MDEKVKSKTIYEDGETLVTIQLTREQNHGLLVFKKRMGLEYHNLGKLCISDFLDRNLTDTEKAHVKYVIQGNRIAPDPEYLAKKGLKND